LERSADQQECKAMLKVVPFDITKNYLYQLTSTANGISRVATPDKRPRIAKIVLIPSLFIRRTTGKFPTNAEAATTAIATDSSPSKQNVSYFILAYLIKMHTR